MPQNDKKSIKRQTRADRRAAEAAAAKAREEQAAKERRQQTMIGAIVAALVVILLCVGGFGIYRAVHKNQATTSLTKAQAYQQLQDVKTKPTRADDEGGVLLSKDGYGQKVSGIPTVAVYMDFLCPGCGNLNRQLDPTLVSLMNAGQINLDLHFMSFLDPSSTDNYSSRAASSALYIADHDDNPDHLLDYISNLFAADFQPGEASAYQSVSDAQLRKQAIAAGVDESVAKAAYSGEYKPWLEAINTYTPKRSELWNSSGSMSTPTVTINGHYWDTSQLATADISVKDAFLQSIGLSPDKVGDPASLPSIGDSQKPKSFA